MSALTPYNIMHLYIFSLAHCITAEHSNKHTAEPQHAKTYLFIHRDTNMTTY